MLRSRLGLGRTEAEVEGEGGFVTDISESFGTTTTTTTMEDSRWSMALDLVGENASVGSAATLRCHKLGQNASCGRLLQKL